MDFVEGVDPVDFDSSPLSNKDDSNSPKRLIGKNAIQSPCRGTAEPEMRGLYILQTMNNDGDLEVLKYASNLSQFRPEVYHTGPVQLALSIFKVRRQREIVFGPDVDVESSQRASYRQRSTTTTRGSLRYFEHLRHRTCLRA